MGMKTTKQYCRVSYASLAGLCCIFLIGFTGLVGAADWRTVTPLPDELKIEPPGPGVAPSVARLSGAWQGALAC